MVQTSKDGKVDGQRNRIGHIPEADHILLNEVKSGRGICFMKLETLAKQK